MMNTFLKNLQFMLLLALAAGLTLTMSCSDDDEPCNEVIFYADVDGDGLGSTTDSLTICSGSKDGYVLNSYDNNDGADFTSKTLMQAIEDVEELDSLEKYLKVYPDLVGLLSSQGTFTVFLPTNLAFRNLLDIAGFPSDIASINPDIIKNVLAYHVATTKYLSSGLTSGLTITTASQGGEKITINSDKTLKTGSTNKEIVIEVMDILTSNGVGHITSTVLIPPTVGDQLEPLLNTNAGTIMLGSDFSILAQAILKADTFATINSKPTLVSILKGEAKNTVFAPSNGTFEAAAKVALTDTKEVRDAKIKGLLDSFTGEQLYGIIATHVVMDNISPSQLTLGAEFTSASTAIIKVIKIDAATTAQIFTGIVIDADGTPGNGNEAQIAVPSSANQESLINPNGQIHVIAGLLSPTAP